MPSQEILASWVPPHSYRRLGAILHVGQSQRFRITSVQVSHQKFLSLEEGRDQQRNSPDSAARVFVVFLRIPGLPEKLTISRVFRSMGMKVQSQDAPLERGPMPCAWGSVCQGPLQNTSECLVLRYMWKSSEKRVSIHPH